MAWPHFEGPVCAPAGEAAGCQAIDTRDPNGFKRSTLPALTDSQDLTAFRS